jgi:hypothetical protein
MTNHPPSESIQVNRNELLELVARALAIGNGSVSMSHISLHISAMRVFRQAGFSQAEAEEVLSR